MENDRRKFLVPLALVFSHLLGLVRVLLISYVFGSSRSADLISFTFSYPNQARKKIEEGTGNLALIRELGEERRSGSVSLFILLFHLAALIVVLLASKPLSAFLFHFTSFSENDVGLGGNLLLSFLIFLVLFSYSSNLNAYLQINGRKEISALLSALPSLFSIIMLYAFKEEKGIYAFPIGLIAGGGIYLIASLIYAVKCGMRIDFTFSFDRPFMGSYFISFLLVLISEIEIIPLFLSSASVEKGSIYFSNAYSILILPYTFLIELFTIAIYPELSVSSREERKERSLEALYTLSYFSFAVFILIASFSNEISVFLFERGRYDYIDCLATGSLLSLTSASIYFHAITAFFQRMMFLNLEGRRIIAASAFKIVLSYLLLLLLPPSIFKSSLILLLSSAATFIFSLLISRNPGQNLMKILLSLIPAIPLMALYVVKRRVDFTSFHTSKIPLMLLSLATGCIVFFFSFLIFILTKKGSGKKGAL